MFLLPLLTAPESAEALLDYRFDRLEAARNNARLQGYRDIQFPWQSFATGDEVTRPSANQAGGAGKQHVNMDVALAFALYAHVTEDPVFIREKAWPVLRGVSKWIESRVTRTERGYEILRVTGFGMGRPRRQRSRQHAYALPHGARRAARRRDAWPHPPQSPAG